MTLDAAARKAPFPPAVLDIEASGFGRGSYPIEIGFVLSSGQAWCSLLRPEPDWAHWDERAAEVHGIRRELLQQHGRSPVDVCNALDSHLGGQTVYSDGWAHDYTWLNRLYDAVGRMPSFRLENLRALLDDDEAAQWHEVKAEVVRRLDIRRHRASADARVLQETLAAVRGRQRVREGHRIAPGH